MAYNNLYRGIRRRPTYNNKYFDLIPRSDKIHEFDLNPQVIDHRMRMLNEQAQADALDELTRVPGMPMNRVDRARNASQRARAEQFLKRSYDEGESNKQSMDYWKAKKDIEGQFPVGAGIIRGGVGPGDESLADNYTKGSRFPKDPRTSGIDIGAENKLNPNRIKADISFYKGQNYTPEEVMKALIKDHGYDVANNPDYQTLREELKTTTIPDTRVEPTTGGSVAPGPNKAVDPLDPTREFPPLPPIEDMYPKGPNSKFPLKLEPPKGGIKGAGPEGLDLIPVPKGRPKGPYGEPPLPPSPPVGPPTKTGPSGRPRPVTPTVVPDAPTRIPPKEPPLTIDATGRPIPEPPITRPPGPKPVTPTVVPDAPVKIPPVEDPLTIDAIGKKIKGGLKGIGPGGGGIGPIGVGSIPPGAGPEPVIGDPVYPGYDVDPHKLHTTKKKQDDWNKDADKATLTADGPGAFTPSMGPKLEPPHDYGKDMSVGKPAPMPEPPRVQPTPGRPAAEPEPEPREPEIRFTPRSILSQRPPRPDLHDPALMGINKEEYKYGNLPDIYNIAQQPKLTPRQQIEDIGRYGQPLPSQQDMAQAPGKWNPEPVQRFDRYGQPLPQGYGYSEAPEMTSPDIVDTAQRYGQAPPDVYGERELPPIERAPKIGAPTPYGEERPGIYDLEAPPEVTQRSTDFEKYGTPESVGRMGPVERFDKFSELNKAEIERPPELGKPGPQGGVDFTKLMDWKNDVGNEKFVAAQFKNDPLAAWRAGLGDMANFYMGGKFEGRAEQALQGQVNREKEFWATEEKRKDSVVNRNLAMKDMGIKEQTLKGNLMNMAAQQNINLRKQDMDYLVEGARLGTDVYKTRVGERLGLGRLALEGDRLQMDALKQYTDSSQDAQKADIGARNTDIANQREKTKLTNETVKDVAQIQEQQDRMLFDSWAKKSGLTGERYRDELARHKQGADEHKDFTQFKMEQERLNAAQEADFQKTRLQGYQIEGVQKSDRYKNLLAKYQAGYATEKDYQDLKAEQAKFNSLQQTKFQENQLKRWETNLAGKSQTFKDSLDKWKAGYATEKDYRELTLEQDKFDTQMQAKGVDQEIDKWKSTEMFKDNRFGKELDKWKAGQKNEFDYLQEKRLRHGLNADETHRYDQLDLEKWKLKEGFKSEQYKNNLTKWNLGQKDLQFATEEERARFDANNNALYKSDSNALTKYGHDADMWRDYNKLPSEIRKNEAEADAYMRKARDEKEGKPLEIAKYVDDLNQKWSTSEEYKGYQQAGTYLGKIIQAPATGFGDTSALYGFIKSIDPTSAVREGERDFALNSMGWLADNDDKVPVGIGRIFEKVKSGKIMTADDRFMLADAAYKATEVNRWRYEDRLAQHEAAMDDFGMGRFRDRLLKLSDFSFGKDANGYPQWTHAMKAKALGVPPYYPKKNPKATGTHPDMPLPDEKPGQGIGPKRDSLND